MAALVVVVWQLWTSDRLIDQFVDGHASLADLVASDHRRHVISGVHVIAVTVAAVVTIVWLYASRTNTESYGAGQFRRAKGWVIGGWFCPIVSFWFPYQCLADVWTASDPSRPTSESAKSRRAAPIVLVWWLLWQFSFVIAWVSDVAYNGNRATVEAFHASHRIVLVASLIQIASGFAFVYVITTVTRFQSDRVRAQPEPQVQYQ